MSVSYTIRHTLYGVHCTAYTVPVLCMRRILYSGHCTVYSVHHTMHLYISTCTSKYSYYYYYCTLNSPYIQIYIHHKPYTVYTCTTYIVRRTMYVCTPFSSTFTCRRVQVNMSRDHAVQLETSSFVLC